MIYLKKGFYIDVSSSECDSDYTKTKLIYTDSEKYAEFLKEVALLCQNKKKGQTKIGNINEYDGFSIAQYEAISNLMFTFKDTIIEECFKNNKESEIKNLFNNFIEKKEKNLSDYEKIYTDFYDMAILYLMDNPQTEGMETRVVDKISCFTLDYDVEVQETFKIN